MRHLPEQGPSESDELLTVKVRWGPLQESRTRLVEGNLRAESGRPVEGSLDFRFAAAVP